MVSWYNCRLNRNFDRRSTNGIHDNQSLLETAFRWVVVHTKIKIITYDDYVVSFYGAVQWKPTTGFAFLSKTGGSLD